MIGGCALVVVLVVVMWWYVHLGTATAKIAQKIVSECSQVSNHSACYETKVPALYPAMSLLDIFNVVRDIRNMDTSYQFCHVLAHKLGERIVAEDPTKWVDDIGLNPKDSMCSNGFIHGVIGGRFRSEVLASTTIATLIPDFRRACEPRRGWDPSDLDRAICYHGMGHLYDFITNADLSAALSLCTQTINASFRRVCIEGVFMQIYQPLEPDDFLLIAQMSIKPIKANVRSFCASYADPEYVGACLRESWPLFSNEIRDGTAEKSFCTGQPNMTQTGYCYDSAATIVGRTSLGHPESAVAACGHFPIEHQQVCFNASAQAVLEEDRNNAQGAMGLCERADSRTADVCLRTLISHSGFLFGTNTSQRLNFCNALPPEYQPSCPTS